jgi:hypothetical protein
VVGDLRWHEKLWGHNYAMIAYRTIFPPIVTPARSVDVRRPRSVAGGGGGDTWTGIVWFGNGRTVVGAPADLIKWADTGTPAAYTGTVTQPYIAVNLRTGAHRFVATPEDADPAEEQVYQVAEPVDATDERAAGFRLTNNTQGDIHARIT